MSSPIAAEALEAIIPQRLDEVITQHRDICTLHLTSEEDLARLQKIIVAGERDAKDVIENWRVVCMHRAERFGGKSHFLLGDALYAESVWSTSPLVGIDFGSRMVLTHSGSIYRLSGPQALGEPPNPHLLQICRMLTDSGAGVLLGVLPVY